MTNTQYRKAFEIREQCDRASCISDFKEQLVEDISSVTGFQRVSFFAGTTFQTPFGARRRVLVGTTEKMFPEYRDRWLNYDLFGSPASPQLLMNTRVALLPQLAATRSLPATANACIRQYLINTRIMHMCPALCLDLYSSHSALIGIFATDDKVPAPDELAVVKLLTPDLPSIGRGIPFVDHHSPFSALAARQYGVVRLIGEGSSNARVAASLCRAEDGLKKYVSRILAASGYQTRTKLGHPRPIPGPVDQPGLGGRGTYRNELSEVRPMRGCSPTTMVS